MQIGKLEISFGERLRDKEGETSDANIKTMVIAHHLQKKISKFIYAKVCKDIANSTK